MEAYEKPRNARRYPEESFSDVVLRAAWSEETVTAAELLRFSRRRGALLADAALDWIEQLKRRDSLPRNNSARR